MKGLVASSLVYLVGNNIVGSLLEGVSTTCCSILLEDD